MNELIDLVSPVTAGLIMTLWPIPTAIIAMLFTKLIERRIIQGVFSGYLDATKNPVFLIVFWLVVVIMCVGSH